MFDKLEAARPDLILHIMAQYRADPRPDKIDLGIGVYKDPAGNTPVMRAVRAAERRLLDGQSTKTYVGLAGDEGFNAAMVGLVFGAAAPRERIAVCQAAGGSGALRTLAELIQLARPGVNVWLPDPTWPNHAPLIGGAGLGIKSYPYYDARNARVDVDAMIAALKTIPAGEVVLLHGCCHNPTGADLTLAQWAAVAEVIGERGLFAFVDLAYQGFGDGLEADAAGVRLLASKLPEMAVASSCSKNFAIYRDRVGAAFVLARDGEAAKRVGGRLAGVTRSLYSMPPDHGAAAVRIVLEDAALAADWRAELEEMRSRMMRLRLGLAAALRQQSNSDRFDFIAGQRGMFSRLGLTPEQVDKLKVDSGIYVITDGRFNVASLPEDKLDHIAQAILAAAR